MLRLHHILLAAALLLPSCSTGSDRLVISGATLIDGTGAPPRHNMDILIRDGRIVEIGTGLSAAGATVVDASGRFVIPGLWDMHFHAAAMKSDSLVFDTLLTWGVTGVRDMGGVPARLRSWRADFATAGRVGPDFRIAGPTLNGVEVAPWHRVVSHPESAASAVSALADAGVQHIKVHNQISPETFHAIAPAAHAHDLALVGHVPRGVSTAEASMAGMRSIEHVEVLIEAAMFQSVAPAANMREAIERHEGETGDSLFAILVQYSTAHTPTLSAYEQFVVSLDEPQRPLGEAVFNRLKSLVLGMHEAGVIVLAGTDDRISPGASLHRELELLVESGMTPMAAIQAATRDPAIAMDVAAETGTIEVGKRADLVILEANPLDDIANTQRIAGVVREGVIVR